MSVLPAPVYVEGTELGYIGLGEQATVLGRSPDSFGEWFYVKTGEDIEGYAYAPYFDWGGEIQALPIVQPTVTVILPPVINGKLEISPGPLSIVHIWPASICNREGGWTARFEIKIKGGDGRNYKPKLDSWPAMIEHYVNERDRAEDFIK